MIRTVLAAVGAASLLGGGVAEAASPAAGLWRAPVNAALIEVYDCGPSTICGRVLDSGQLHADPGMRDVHNPDAALRDRPVKGMQMMQGFKGGPMRWAGGRLYNPDDGHSYPASITLVDFRTLKLAGCLFGPFCATQVWTRAQ